MGWFWVWEEIRERENKVERDDEVERWAWQTRRVSELRKQGRIRGSEKTK